MEHIDDGFWVALAEKYPRQSWQTEQDPIRDSISKIAEQLSKQYAIQSPIAVGGGGVAILVEDLNLTSPGNPIYAVLKVARPVQGQTALLNTILQRETERLRELRHQNVMRILTYGEVQIDDNSTPFYLMEYLDHPKDADEHLKSNPGIDQLMSLLMGAVAGLDYMHTKGTAHLDIKPANILVSNHGTSVVIGDLGFAKRIGEDHLTSYVGGTAGYKHPEHDRLIREASESKLDLTDPNRELSEEQVLVSRIKSYWDIYSLGVTLLVLLRVLELNDSRVVTDYRYRYLALMAYRMLGKNVQYASVSTTKIPGYGRDDETHRPLVEDHYLGIRRDAMQQLQYASTGQILQDLQKLWGTRDLLRDVPELSFQPRTVVQAASHSSVPFTARVRALLDSPEVRSLGKLDQLGLVRLVYPTASHSRLEHSLGTLAMASRFVRALYGDSISPVFRQLMSREDVELLLALCLVHDIGHYPLAHDLEEVDRDVFSHELRTAALLTRPGSGVGAALSASAPDGWGVDPVDVSRILTANPQRDLSLREMVVRSVIDGPIDADKLDYLIRDSENLRLPYGRGVDFEKLMQCLTVVVRDDGQGSAARIGINNKGKIPAESVAFARYAMYGSVYWHRTHRTAKAMLNRIGLEVMEASKRRRVGSHYKEHLRRKLYEFLQQEEEGQLSFDLFDHGLVATSPYVDLPTQRMVMWLVEQIPDNEDFQRDSFVQLANDLLSRRLYRRVLVLSRARAQAVASPQSWMRAESVFGTLGAKWENRRQSMMNLQRRLTEIVSEWDGSVEPGVTSASLSQAESFVAEASSRPLVIIDYPPVKTGSRSVLEYVQEEEWSELDQGPRVDELEPSSMWASLVEQYSEGLGKLRVYVHPDYASVVQAAVPRDELARAMWSSLDVD